MVSKMTLNYMFYLGVIIPTVITVTLFVIFLVCFCKYRVRQKILHKRHDPHRRLCDSSDAGSVRTSSPPLPPSAMKYRNNNIDKNKSGNYEDCDEPNMESSENQNQTRTIYRTDPDSGVSGLGDTQCKMDDSGERPNSQASTDSEDSGFRSSRSGQYIHSASSSNAQENGNSSEDPVPLFKPIKNNPNETGPITQLPKVHRNSNSSKHKKQRRNQPPHPSQNCIEIIDSHPLSHHHHHPQRHQSQPEIELSHLTPVPQVRPEQTRHIVDLRHIPLHCDPHSQSLHHQNVPMTHSLHHGDINTTSLHNNILMSPSMQLQNGNVKTVSQFQPMRLDHIQAMELNVQPDFMFQPIHPPRIVSDKLRPLTITTATVHRPFVEDSGDPRLQSVV